MKAVIVSDLELVALVDRLELTKMKEDHFRNTTPEALAAWESAHRAFHYIVWSWIQEVGGSPKR